MYCECEGGVCVLGKTRAEPARVPWALHVRQHASPAIVPRTVPTRQYSVLLPSKSLAYVAEDAHVLQKNSCALDIWEDFEADLKKVRKNSLDRRENLEPHLKKGGREVKRLDTVCGEGDEKKQPLDTEAGASQNRAARGNPLSNILSGEFHEGLHGGSPQRSTLNFESRLRITLNSRSVPQYLTCWPHTKPACPTLALTGCDHDMSQTEEDMRGASYGEDLHMDELQLPSSW
ncbi:hypothetical protein Bbelb_347150 [Branchiostoma belcheri]|nr:hypothetical protein Bbelb_347150 [Branchiostoma belcheri]